MMFRSMPRLLAPVASFVLPIVPLLAIEPSAAPRLADKARRHVDLEIANRYVLLEEVAAHRAGDLAALNATSELARLDPRTGRWGTLILSEPIFPGAANDLSWGLPSAEPKGTGELQNAVWDAFVAWIARNRAPLRVDPSELLAPGHVTLHRDGSYVQIHAPRVVAGIRVRDSYLTAVIQRGNLTLFGARNWGDLTASPSAGIELAQAEDRLARYLGRALTDRGRGHLEYVPLARGSYDEVEIGNGLGFRLAWALRPRLEEVAATEWEALVDAHSGELLAFEDVTGYAGSTRTVIGDVYPRTTTGIPPEGVLQSYPMPYAYVTNGAETLVTDTGGNLAACLEGEIATDLTGPFLTLFDHCGAISETTSGSVLDLEGVAGTNCDVPPGHSAGDTNAARTAFYELGKMQEMARSHLPSNSWLQAPLQVDVNVNGFCNALGGVSGLLFYREGSVCSNSGEIAGILDHEWGHGMDGADANPGFSNPSEGIADIYASLRINDSCIGENFLPGSPCSGYGDACLTCTGITDVDWAQRTSGAPHDLAGIDSLCGSGGSAPCGGDAFCEGALTAESVWDLWNRDLTSPPYSMSLDTAREVATRLTFQGATLVGTWYNCVGGTGIGDGCNADGGYLNYLAADDDNANLADGTPHMAAIFAAFDRHGIACDTPTVQDSGCAGGPTTAPSNVTATPRDRGVDLEWDAVAGASSYRVFRTEGELGCDFGKALVGETTGTSFADAGLANGRTYSYIVVAIGPGDSCYGPASSCTNATPIAGPAFVIGPDPQLQILTGDGDDFIDNCEDVRVQFSIENRGAGILTDVEIVGVSSPSHPGIDASIAHGGVLVGSLSPCDSVVRAFDFRAVDLSFDDELVFEVEVKTAGTPFPQVQTFTVPFAESDFSAPGPATFSFEGGSDGWTVRSGTFGRVGGGGADGTTFSMQSSSNTHEACDRIVSPPLVISPSSTLTLWNNFEIEPMNGGVWYDRANLGVLDSNGGRQVVEPDGGRLYDATGSYSGCNPDNGWAGTQDTWGTSTFSAGAFGAIAAGELKRLEVTYGTDQVVSQRGFAFDEVMLTDVGLQVPDGQPDACGPSALLIFADGFESGNTSAWSATLP